MTMSRQGRGSKKDNRPEENGVDGTASDDEAEDISGAGPFSEPTQDPRERRQIRHEYRQILHDAQERKLDLINPESNELDQMLKTTNKLFSRVKMTREAALDSTTVNLISQMGKQKAQALHTNLVTFQPSEFAIKLVSFLNNGALPEGTGDDDERKITPQQWTNLGEACQPFFKKSPSLHFMFGAFERGPPKQKEVKKARQAVEQDNENLKTKTPIAVKNATEITKKEATTEEVEKIHGILERLYQKNENEPICFFEFTVNPNSFGQTVENVFYTSFLIRDGLARIFLDDDKLPVIEPVEKRDGDRPDENLPRSQVVMTVNREDWQEIVKTFKIRRPLIPTRQSPDETPSGSERGSEFGDVDASAAGPSTAPPDTRTKPSPPKKGKR